MVKFQEMRPVSDVVVESLNFKIQKIVKKLDITYLDKLQFIVNLVNVIMIQKLVILKQMITVVIVQ